MEQNLITDSPLPFGGKAIEGVIPGYRWVCIGYMRDWNTCGQKWKQKSCDTL